MRCASCEAEVCQPDEAFTGDVCPLCHHFAHPTRLGIYEGLELIKRGGMGSVYRARHPKLGTTVAIKAVQTNTGPMTLAARFEREAALAARIPHPGIVRVYDYDCQEGRLYLVMEYVEGATLRQHVREGGRDLDWCLDKVAQLADILQAAHDQGIVHRDIKPENVMVEPTGKVRLLDLGVSCVVEDGDRLTQPGEILGTPEYISPEQILEAPDAIDARTDIYSTGVVLYELLTGRSPFAGSNLFQVLKYVESLTPPPPSELRPGTSTELEALVMQCIAKDRAERPASAGHLARRLRSLRTAGSVVVRRDRKRLVAVVGVVGLLVGFGAAQFYGGERSATESGAEPVPQPSYRRLATMLGRGVPVESTSLLSLARTIGDDAPPLELHWRGIAHKHSGALFLAHRDFELARAGHPEAASQAGILWVYKHKLVPIVLGGPRWLLAAGSIESNGGVAGKAGGEAAGKAGGEAADDLRQGLSALARNDYELAARRLHACRLRGPDRQVLLALIAYLRGDRRVAVEALRRGSHDYLPQRMLMAVLDPGTAVEELRTVLLDVDRTLPMRYFLEVAIAMREGNLRRLRAATELALVAGEAPDATAVYLAARVWFADQLEAAEIPTLLAMAKTLDRRLPGATCTVILLARAAGDRKTLAERLERLAGTSDPTRAYFAAWQAAADPEFYDRLHETLYGLGGSGWRGLSAWLKARPELAIDEADEIDEVELARRYLAASVLGSRVDTTVRGRVRTALLAALTRAKDLQVFRQQLASSPCRQLESSLALEALHQGVRLQVDPAHLLPLVRAAMDHGCDPRTLLQDPRLQPLYAEINKLLPGGRDG